MCLGMLFIANTGPTWAGKIVHQRSVPWRHHNALHDPQGHPNAKTQVLRNVSQCTFCGVHTGPIRAWKIVHRHFLPRTNQNAICDPYIAPDAKTQVRRDVSRRAFYGIKTGPTWAWKIVRRGLTSRTHYMTCRSTRMQKHMFGLACPDSFFVGFALCPTEEEK
jgi:hypothetical protein